jgi:hypothetical protein
MTYSTSYSHFLLTLDVCMYYETWNLILCSEVTKELKSVSIIMNKSIQPHSSNKPLLALLSCIRELLRSNPSLVPWLKYADCDRSTQFPIGNSYAFIFT